MKFLHPANCLIQRVILILLICSTAKLPISDRAWAETKLPIRIGWTGPLTGNSAVLGIDSVKAAELAVEEVNAAGGISGRPVELLVEDDQYDTKKSVGAYTKLVAQGAIAIIASSYGGIFATAERAAKDGVIVIDPLDCNDDIAALPENTFCIATQSESIGRIISEEINKRKAAPVAVIYDERNPFMDLVQKVIRKAHDTEADKFFGVDQSSADFKSILLKVRDSDIKSMVLLGHDPMGQAMREARAIGIQSQFYTVGTITSPGYQELAGSAAEGTLVAYWEAPRGKAFEDFSARFKAKVGRPPILELATIPSYDATRVLLGALSKAGIKNGRPDTAGIREGLLALRDYSGLSGRISMDPDGAVRTIRESIYRFDHGQLQRQK